MVMDTVDTLLRVMFNMATMVNVSPAGDQINVCQALFHEQLELRPINRQPT